MLARGCFLDENFFQPGMHAIVQGRQIAQADPRPVQGTAGQNHRRHNLSAI
jgi:hypothetical protein